MIDHDAMSQLSENARSRIFRFLCKLANSDGVIHPEELKVLEKFRINLDIDPAVAVQLALESQSKQIPLGNNKDELEIMVVAIVEVVTADGEFDSKEQSRVMSFARSVGVSTRALDKLIKKALSRNHKTRIIKRDKLNVPIQLTEADFDCD